MNTLLNPAVARKYGYYPAIFYAFLQKEQLDHATLNDQANTRMGIKWIVSLSYETIQREVPVFPDAKTVRLAANELVKGGLVLRESTGAFLQENLKTGRKRDIASWWHVSREHVAKKSVPLEYFDTTKLVGFNSEEAREQGISAALITAYLRKQPGELIEDNRSYRTLTATKIELALPMDEKTARRQIKKLVASGKLIQHRKRKKLYAAA